MYSSTKCCIIRGIDGIVVDVESEILNGLTSFNIVGLPGNAVKEAKERIRSSFLNLDIRLPIGRTIINLTPADLRKEGTHLDLSIAISILKSMKILKSNILEDLLIIGELALDGRILSVRGALSMVICAKQKGMKYVLIPAGNVYECSMVDGINIITAYNLNSVIELYKKSENINEIFDIKQIINTIDGVSFIDEQYKEKFNINIEENNELDYKDILGQSVLKRAMQIAAAGNHSILLNGSPGVGKTMSALRLPSIMPNLHEKEILECTKIASISGILEKNKIMNKRPFRMPHYTITKTGLIGGGIVPKPGEVTLAHNGILFLDELTEFNKTNLELLRVPIERKKVLISRNTYTVEFPSNFQLICSMNPCPCGMYGDSKLICTCNNYEIKKYKNKLSKPFLDRIDMYVKVSRNNEESSITQSSYDLKKKVDIAINMQKERYNSLYIKNSNIEEKIVKDNLYFDYEIEKLIKLASDKYTFSMRTNIKLRSIARTIADLEESNEVKKHHFLEAINYKNYNI